MKRYKRLLEIEANELINLITPEMEKFFNDRIVKHIRQVQNNLKVIYETYPSMKDELKKRGNKHDLDKLVKPYYYSQVLRVWSKSHPEFIRDPEVKKLSGKAVFKHIKSNRHHIEYHRDVRKMSDYDLAEMIADNAAMSKEFHTSLKDWVIDNIFAHHQFTRDQYDFIKDLVELFY